MNDLATDRVSDAPADIWVYRLLPGLGVALCATGPLGQADRMVVAVVALLVVAGSGHRIQHRIGGCCTFPGWGWGPVG